jgi:hypothetical protein
VGYNFGLTSPSTVPGGLNNITGNDGKAYPVQKPLEQRFGRRRRLLRRRRGRPSGHRLALAFQDRRLDNRGADPC